MHKRVRRLFSAVFLLALFLGSKGIEVHALSHTQDNDQITCEWCDYALVLQDTPFEPTLERQLDFTHSVLAQNHVDTQYVSNPKEGLARESLFGRPPPAN